jgi:hypothetical protein
MLLNNNNIKRIHVNQHNIRSNLKNNHNLPPLTVKTSKSNIICHDVVIHGSSRVVYSPDKPLSCGARVWIETHSPIETTEDQPCLSPD